MPTHRHYVLALCHEQRLADARSCRRLQRHSRPVGKLNLRHRAGQSRTGRNVM